MKNLTILEKVIVGITIGFLLFLSGLMTVNSVSVFTTVLAVIGIIWVGVVVIISTHALNNERKLKETIKDYNEIRKQVLITTKFNVHTLNEAKSLTYMICSRSGKSKFCSECKHRDVHLWSPECEEVGCEPSIRIQQ